MEREEGGGGMRGVGERGGEVGGGRTEGVRGVRERGGSMRALEREREL